VAQGQRQFIDAALLDGVVPEQGGEVARRLALGGEAEAMCVVGQAVHDVGDRHLARAAHHAVVAGGAHEHRVGPSTSSRLPARIIMKIFCGECSQALEVGGAGAGADAALHAHLDHVAFFDVGLDFLEEVVAVTFQGAEFAA
jgi:hypothetical protein